jgi:phosphoglycerate dehydrogenase-like enzyme
MGDGRFKLLNGHGNSSFVAQHAVALLLALTNRVIQHHRWMAEGRWRTGDREGASRPLRHLTVGLLGYGAIGQKIHRFLAGFDVRFAALRTHWPTPHPADGEASPTPFDRYSSPDLDDFLEAVDVVFATLPSTPETRGLLGRAALRRLGPDGLLVNVGRGAVIDEDDLFEALQAREIAGAAIDVWFDDPEPGLDGPSYPYRRPFHNLPNVVLSPHRGASPLDDLERWSDVVENLRRLARGETDLLNVVDIERGY